MIPEKIEHKKDAFGVEHFMTYEQPVSKEEAYKYVISTSFFGKDPAGYGGSLTPVIKGRMHYDPWPEPLGEHKVWRYWHSNSCD